MIVLSVIFGCAVIGAIVFFYVRWQRTRDKADAEKRRERMIDNVTRGIRNALLKPGSPFYQGCRSEHEDLRAMVASSCNLPEHALRRGTVDYEKTQKHVDCALAFAAWLFHKTGEKQMAFQEKIDALKTNHPRFLQDFDSLRDEMKKNQQDIRQFKQYFDELLSDAKTLGFRVRNSYQDYLVLIG